MRELFFFSSLLPCSQHVMLTANLRQLCRGPQRNCTPAMCRDRFHSLLRSSWWPTDRARLFERRAILSVTQPRAFMCLTSHIIYVHSFMHYISWFKSTGGSTLCVWYTMMALSDSVSTTWKFSIVAKGGKEMRPISVLRKRNAAETWWETVKPRTHSPSLIGQRCPRSSGRPRGPSRPSQRVWLWEDPERFRSPPPLSCTPDTPREGEQIKNASARASRYKTHLRGNRSATWINQVRSLLYIIRNRSPTVEIKTLLILFFIALSSFPQRYQAYRGVCLVSNNCPNLPPTPPGHSSMPLGCKFSPHFLSSALTFISPSSITSCQLASPPTSWRE